MPEAPGQAQQTNRLRLGEMLVAENVITQAQLGEALRAKADRGVFLGRVLVELGFMSQNALTAFLVKQCKIPHLNLLDYHIAKDVLAMLPRDICLSHGVLPIDRLGKILTVAMVDPLDIEALEDIRRCCPDLRIKPILCEWNQFEQVARRDLGASADSPNEEVSMESFGFVSRTPKPDVTASPAPPAPPQPETRPAQPQQAQTPAAPPGAISAQALSGIVEGVNTSIRQAMHEVTEALNKQAINMAASQPSLPSMEEMTALLRDSLRAAMPEHPGAEAQPPAEIIEALRGALQGAVRDAIAGMPQPTAHDSSGAQLPEAAILGLRDSLADMIRTSVAAAVSSASPGAVSAAPSMDSLLEPLQAGIRLAVKEAITSQAGAAGTGRADAMLQVNQAVMHALESSQAAESARQAIESLQEKQILQEARFNQATKAAVDASEAAQRAIEAASASQQLKVAELLKTAQDAVQAALASHQNEASSLLEAAQHAAIQAREEAARAEAQVAAAREVEAAAREAATSQRSFLRSGSYMRRKREARALLGKAESDALEAMEGPGIGLHLDERILAALQSEAPLPGHTFDTFLGDKVNAFTLRVCRAVAETPGGEFSPLFIHGGVGSGKTHLANAIGNRAIQINPESQVGYIAVSRFAARLTQAQSENALDGFQEYFCQWDLLILDDLQAITAHQDAQEQLLEILGVLIPEGRQVVVTAETPPDRLEGMDRRLASRLASGIVAKVQAPETDGRIELLRRQAGQAIPDTALSRIALRAPSDMRRMMGALRKVAAFSRLVEQEVTPELVDEILDHLVAE